MPGPCGAGHFVKMVHNGIEYGLMQAYAEGFDILRNADANGVAPEHRFTLNISDVAEVWRRGSVVTSWLLDLTASALAREGVAGVLFRLRRGFRRGPLDHPGGDRRGRPRRSAVRFALHPVPLAPDTTPSRRRSSPRCARVLADTSSRSRGSDGARKRASLAPTGRLALWSRSKPMLVGLSPAN